MSERATGEPYRVPAVMSAAAIVEAIAAAPDGMTHSALVRELGISKSTTHNLLATLESLGWLRRDPRDPRGRAYRLGSALSRLGAVAARQVDALTLAIERAHALVAEHLLTIAVARPLGRGDVEVVAVARGGEHDLSTIEPGTCWSWFDGAAGKCLLALEPRAAAQRLVRERAGQIPAHTGRTLTDPDALLADVERVRTLGYAVSIGEHRLDNAVAAAVRDADGGAVALLVAIGAPERLTRGAIPSIGRVLRDTAAEIAAECDRAAPAGGSVEPFQHHPPSIEP